MGRVSRIFLMLSFLLGLAFMGCAEGGGTEVGNPPGVSSQGGDTSDSSSGAEGSPAGDPCVPPDGDGETEDCATEETQNLQEDSNDFELFEVEE